MHRQTLPPDKPLDPADTPTEPTLVPFDDGAIAFREGHDQLVLLDKMGRALWELQPWQAPEDVAVELSRTLSVSLEQARSDLEPLIEIRERLLGADITKPDAGERRRVASPTGAFTSRRYAMNGTVFEVRFFHPTLETGFRQLFGHLEETTRSPVAPGPTFDLLHDTNDVVVLREGSELGRSDQVRVAIVGLKEHVVDEAHRRADWLTTLHAGGVCIDGVALLFPGRGGSGKSTLTAALAAAGHPLLSDDHVPILASTLQAVPVPIAIGLRQGSWALLQDAYPTIDCASDAEHQFVPPKTAQSAPAPVGALIFVEHETHADATATAPLSPWETLVRLSETGLRMDPPLTRSRVERLVSWLKAVPAFTLTHGNLEDAVKTIEALPVRTFSRRTRAIRGTTKAPLAGSAMPRGSS